MSVDKLITQNFRNLDSVSINFHPRLNFFIGDNGSGKSSLLEALFFLGHGKSFRTTKVDSLARHETNSFVVSVRDSNDHQLGLSRDLTSGLTNIKIDGQRYNRLSVLAKNIAIQIVTPESFKLFFGGPKERRRFIDLGMFHVKHDFSTLWKSFNRVLKQRNASIRLDDRTKSVNNNSMLSYWTEQFCQLSIELSTLRASYVSEIISELNCWLAILLPSLKERVTVQYLQGWSQKNTLIDVLTSNQEREASFGYSLYGAHKFDVKFLLDKKAIETELSRGQQKLFLLALTFAQTSFIARVKRVKPILLIDDIGAELDSNSRTALSKAIDELDCQVIITAIESSVLQPFLGACEDRKYSMFHVKHGKVLEIYPDDSEFNKSEKAM
ncbi:DNA replication/repair protein RecF [Candidatus Colwellia aromaticivorans]|uniref:DNA replication/repair protein RecF n=1 Tax=Candidatus Colwellia aromaticivorans TaxID=2267621 RepID=UPI000DF2B4C6|nr:DNA replication/repair protein RecF [Candidatus Colwellia aromaticivorans]